MNREAKIYLLAVDAEERRILMRLPDSTLDLVASIKKVFGKNARIVSTEAARPIKGSYGQQRLI